MSVSDGRSQLRSTRCDAASLCIRRRFHTGGPRCAIVVRRYRFGGDHLPTIAPPSVHGLRVAAAGRRLRLLVLVRVINSFGDGAFQGALVGAVLFSPERAADPMQLATGFAVMLLPYSVIGPFVGSLLDRWSRRQVLVWANVLRCAVRHRGGRRDRRRRAAVAGVQHRAARARRGPVHRVRDSPRRCRTAWRRIRSSARTRWPPRPARSAPRSAAVPLSGPAR